MCISHNLSYSLNTSLVASSFSFFHSVQNFFYYPLTSCLECLLNESDGNELSHILSEHMFISPSLYKNMLTGYGNLGWQLHSSSSLMMSFHGLLIFFFVVVLGLIITPLNVRIFFHY